MAENHELPKTYSPSEFEDRLYKFWCDNNYFTPDPSDNRPSFSVVIPPPNVTGQLHMGHALDETLQDIIVRYKRMQGFNTLWVPGTDHAGIATQIKVEEQLRVNEGLTRYDLGREEFLERVWDWKNRFGDRIISQLKKLGTSCDWSRERFTMDEGCSKAVKEAFVNLYNKGLIYRGHRIINWCPHCATALSDAEVEYKDQPGFFWHIKYPVKDSKNGEYVEIATTRPETMFGDTAVAVNPNDEATKHLIGKTLILPIVGREIPVIADDYVEIGFGTGCVKITPAHDPNDFMVGQRHGLEQIKVMNDDATMNSYAGKYEGMDRYACRKALVEELKEKGYLVKVVPHEHNVGVCYRCGTTVEPITSDQWFVKMKPLAAPAIEAVRDGRINFVPERFSKNYFNWMENILDWCISRQLWWGHRIPAFYCDTCGHMTVSKEDITVCPECGAPVRQESDVLDTWFSSALWPFSTLGWPEKTADLEKYYPTSVLVTGYDIITFWVSRMIFSGLEHMHKEPFSTVFIHGLVRDAQGRKMSKSLGNGIDPLEIIDKYGADALRFALATGNSPGNDMRFSDEKIESARNFANKLWNASRFVRMNLTIDKVELPDKAELATEDKWLLDKFNSLVATVVGALDKYEVGVALSSIYDFTWDILCDWYIELAKARLNEKGTKENEVCQNVISYVLIGTLKLLHPFMPFITEEIYQSMPHECESIMISDYPKCDASLEFEADSAEMTKVIDAIKAIRARRSEMNVAPSKKAKIYIATKHTDAFNAQTEVFFMRLASASEVIVAPEFDAQTVSADNSVQIITDSATIYLPLSDIIDFEKERARLANEKKRLIGEIERIEKKLSNEGFTAKAPAAVVEGERQKMAKYREMLDGVEVAIAKLG
ncbi:MAG: valine--tRNA ligase [Clostridia bacterium]|nr:valine--tRNA ligase [Clostridia bacterium]MDY3785419.1 valine--tRNA ligase [Eubacteriales bacterium]